MTTDEKIDLLVEEVSKINTRLDGIDNRLDDMQDDMTALKADVNNMQDDISIIKADVKTVKKHVQFNRRTELDIIDYVENRVDEKLERFKAEISKSA